MEQSILWFWRLDLRRNYKSSCYCIGISKLKQSGINSEEIMSDIDENPHS